MIILNIWNNECAQKPNHNHWFNHTCGGCFVLLLLLLVVVWMFFLGRWIWLKFSWNSKNWSWALGFGLKPRISFALTIAWKHFFVFRWKWIRCDRLLWLNGRGSNSSCGKPMYRVGEHGVYWLGDHILLILAFSLSRSISHTHTVACTHTVYCIVDRLLLFRCTWALLLPLPSPSPRLFRRCVCESVFVARTVTLARDRAPTI